MQARVTIICVFLSQYIYIYIYIYLFIDTHTHIFRRLEKKTSKFWKELLLETEIDRFALK